MSRFAWLFRRRKPAVLKDLIRAHMRSDCHMAESVAHRIKPVERVNLQLALDARVAADPAARLIGYGRESMFSNVNMGQLLHEEIVQAPVQRERVETGVDQELDCVMRGVYLMHSAGKPVVVSLSNPDSFFEAPTLELLANDRAAALAALAEIIDDAAKRQIYKGKTIYLEQKENGSQTVVKFKTLPPIDRESLILPEEVLQVVERNVLGMIRHADVLRRSGRAIRHGLLLHGPPGTGKTLMLRYLASACPGYTVVLMTGRQLGLVRESCAVARMLAPSLVMLEDVDLIGGDRESNGSPVQLQDLMDEMDGLGPKADVMFLLTTNRPEVLEPALSSRPGRIDQAVEFPLPDEGCRRRLFDLYGKGLDITALDLPRWISRTDGVSPAFIEELFRKATLMAAERGESAATVRLTDDDVEKAMNELVCFGGELTQRLLGYRPFGFGQRKPT